MSVEKKKGTAAETAVVVYLQASGFKTAERRTTRGAKDAGDIAGVPGVTIEVKDCQRLELAAWVDEAVKELVNANAGVAVVWHKRRGKGSPADWYVTMTGLDFVTLLMDAMEPEES